MGAAVFIFCDDEDLVTKVAQGFAKFQDENIDTEKFGTPFLDTISTAQSIYLYSHLDSTPTAPAEVFSSRRPCSRLNKRIGFREYPSVANNGGSQRGHLIRLRHPRPAWADGISADKQKERRVTFTTPTAQQKGTPEAGTGL